MDLNPRRRYRNICKIDVDCFSVGSSADKFSYTSSDISTLFSKATFFKIAFASSRLPRANNHRTDSGRNLDYLFKIIVEIW